MPKVPFSKEELRKSKDQWYNSVRYEIWDDRQDKPLKETQYVCYSSISSSVKSVLQNNPEDIIKHGFTRYFCKNGDNELRTKFMIYILKFFEPLYRKLHIYWSEEHKEIIVDAYWKPTTPMDSIYALGSFLRLSWEQWYLHKFGETRNFEILCQTSTSDYTGHIPTLFLTSYSPQFKEPKNGKPIGRIATAILLNLIRKKKVYKRELKSCVEGRESMNIGHRIQITAYNAVTGDPRFKSHNFQLAESNNADW